MLTKIGDQRQPGRNLLLSLCPDVSAGAMPCGRTDAEQRKKKYEGGGESEEGENKRRLRERDRVKNG